MHDALFNQNREVLLGFLAEAQDVGIVISERQDLDKIGAALGLFLSLQTAGKNIQVVSKREPIVEYSSLVGIDKVKKKFDGTVKTLTISFPYREGEIEKVSYNIENDRLNVNLFATDAGVNFREEDISYIRKGSTPSLIFAFGVARIEDLESVLDLSTHPKIINIDTNPGNTKYGDILYVEPSFSSLSEIVSRMIEDLRLPRDLDNSQNLLDGIIQATHNFSSPRTSSYAFEEAGYLMRSGAKREKGRQDAFVKQQSFRPASQQSRESQRPTQSPQQKKQEDMAHGDAAEEEQEAVASANNISEEDVPSDWFVPKVFKSSKKQD